MSIIAVSNIKGGVGKTATSVNLAYLSAMDGINTLLCDMDSQGSASYYFRIRPKKKFNTKKFLRGGKHIDRNIRGTDYPGLDLLPADFSFRNIDIALDGLKKSTQRIGKILAPLQREYGCTFLDCPPNVTLLSENIFHAADIILIPLIPTTLSILALKKLLEFLGKMNYRRFNVLVFFSMVEKRKKMHVEMMQRISEEHRILPVAIPYLADVEKMGVYRQPVTAAMPGSAATIAYQKLWTEIRKHLER
ncbi:MAG: ParA family protein [Thermodesulfobacteriota bacterium]|nr:ParA family protein [Thermodesulfobacteriota bacterium]